MLSDNSSPRLIDKAQRFLEVSREAFDQQVTCFLVIVNERDCPSKLLSSEEWMTIIEVSGSNAVANAAAQIRDQLYTSIPAERMLQLSPAVIMDTLPEAGLLSDVLVNFRTRISPDAFEVLRSEAASFHREYSSAHYTTSALCVGRMLEFTIYTLDVGTRTSPAHSMCAHLRYVVNERPNAANGSPYFGEWDMA